MKKRKRKKLCVNEGGETTKKQGARISSYDYGAWDRFDVVSINSILELNGEVGQMCFCL